jgi:phosphopantothenoylcysteine decarboxylase/phosphopantothenate--cysteine ligase
MNPFVTDNLRPSLQGKRILLGISGSIAAFKACDIIRYLKGCGADVRVVLTDSAHRFVTPVTLETLSENPVYSSLWPDTAGAPTQGTHHIDAARWADLALIAPATANTIAKLAQGLADDLLSTEMLAFRGPIVLAPAMNPAMYGHPAVQANLKLLQDRGVIIAGPTHGVTSCGEEGLGRMSEPESLVEQVAQCFYASANGKKILITLGPTRSAIDPVRYVTNRSSGLMGAALAWAARRAGFEVTVVAGPTSAALPSDVGIHSVQTAREMFDRTSAAFAANDVLIGAAAVLDWDVKNPASQKRKKEDAPLTLEFEANPDILATLGAQKQPGQYVLGFAAETQNIVESGIQKRLRKHCDAIFANDVSLSSQGFENNSNGGWWITSQEIFELPVRPKTELASLIIRLVSTQFGGPKPEGLLNLTPSTTKVPAGLPEPHAYSRPDDARVS